LKGLLKGFWWPFRSLKSVKYSWSYGPNKVCDRKYWSCKKFRYLAYNCRNKNKEKKRKLIPKNKFEVLLSRMIRCGVREKVRIRRNEIVEEVKCFRCWGVRHFK